MTPYSCRNEYLENVEIHFLTENIFDPLTWIFYKLFCIFHLYLSYHSFQVANIKKIVDILYII